jgi:GNAT superfamily N-acetyltransferase
MSTYSLRPIAPGDRELLFRIYASTRAEELAQVDWAAEQREAFLRQQFEAQHAWYQQNYAGAAFDVVLASDGQPAGRLYVACWPREIRLIDVALLPGFRRQGLGSAILGDLLAGARRSGKPVTIHVERMNPALRLYERLGFKQKEDKGVYLFLEWAPATVGDPA